MTSLLASFNAQSRRATRRTIGAWIVAGCVACVAASAGAHAVLLDQFPLQASVLSSAPSEIRLHFNEPVTPISVRVLGGRGQSMVAADDVAMVDTTLHVRFPKDAQPGTYVVSYRVLSEDSHPVGDSFVFSIGQSSDMAAANTTVAFADEKKWSILADIDRAVFYATLLLAAGGALFLAQFAAHIPGLVQRNRSMVVLAAVVAAASAVTGVIINGALLEAAPMRDVFDMKMWRAGWQGSLRDNVVVTLLGLGLIGVAVTMNLQRIRSIALVGGALAAVGGLTLSGHAATAAPRWLMAPAVGVHALCAAYWIGALVPLRRHLASAAPRQTASTVNAFSKSAIAAVSLLFIAGCAIACVQVGRPSALFSTPYGQWLIIKLGLFALLLVAAAINKWRYTPGLAAGDHNSVRRLRMTIGVELAAAAGIAIATATLGGATPPRALQDQQSERSMPGGALAGVSVRIVVGDRTAAINVVPGAVGNNALSIALLDSRGGPLDAVEVDVLVGSAALAIEPREYRAKKNAAGKYAIDAVAMPIAGVWEVIVEATVSDFEKSRFDAKVSIR